MDFSHYFIVAIISNADFCDKIKSLEHSK